MACEKSFSSEWFDLKKGESREFTVDLTDCDDGDLLVVFGYVAKRKSAPQIRMKDSILLEVEDLESGYEDFTYDKLFIDPVPKEEYVIVVTNESGKEKRLRIRGVVI